MSLSLLAAVQEKTMWWFLWTKWPEVFGTADQTSPTIAKLLVEEIISQHGVPSELLSDRGTMFLSKLDVGCLQTHGHYQTHTTLKPIV